MTVIDPERAATRRSYARGRLLVLPILLALAACQEVDVYSGLDQKDANEMLVVITAEGIKATRTEASGGKFGISVAKADLSAAAAALAAAGLPREPHVTTTAIFPADGLIVTPFELRARAAYAQSQEVANLISAIPGVATVRVRVTTPEEAKRLSGETASATAMVQLRPGADPLDVTAKARSVLANSLPMIDARQVSVIVSESEQPLTTPASINVPTLKSPPGSASPTQVFTAAFKGREVVLAVGLTLIGIAIWMVTVARRPRTGQR